MDLSTSHYIQLIIALSAGIAVFAIAYTAPARYVMPVLLLLTPFQLITSKYGSLNMVLIYLTGAAFLIKGRVRLWPLAGSILFICMAYLLSLSQAARGTYFVHIFYLVSIGSNFVLFYIVYNFAIQSNNPRFILNIFIWLSALVSLYCLLSFLVGFDKIAILGVEELSFGRNMEREQRLVGPYGAPGTNSEFLALQIIFLLYVSIQEQVKWKRIVIPVLMAANFAFLVATGSRGGFVTLVIGAILYLWLFRRELGAKGLLRISLMGTVFAVVALAVISFTEFNVLFERLGTTEIKGYEIDTRSGLLDPTLEAISQNSVLGHGPKMKIYSEEAWKNAPYPHNLYLFLPYTIGIFGLIAYLVFFVSLILRLHFSRSTNQADLTYHGISTLAIVLLIMFLASQYRIEFLRIKLVNYQHYLFALWAALLALADLAKQQGLSSKNVTVQKNTRILNKRSPKNK